METKRSAGKKMIAAQASAAIWSGVDEWLRRNGRKSVTDFVLEACMEKLDLEKIPYDRDAALFDGRRRVPTFALNDQSSSAKVENAFAVGIEKVSYLGPKRKKKS